MPIARRLGEKVLENCATKIRPSLIQSVKSLDISLDDYSSVLANICQETSGVVGKDDLDASGEHLVCISMFSLFSLSCPLILSM